MSQLTTNYIDNLLDDNEFNLGSQTVRATHHNEGHRADKSRFGDIHNSVVHYVKKQQPSPGAMSYALESLALPEFSPIGAGVHPRQTLMFDPRQPIQKYVGHAVPYTGYGGVLAGQIVFQPLYDPASNTYGGVALE